jgi:hypothetical protein
MISEAGSTFSTFLGSAGFACWAFFAASSAFLRAISSCLTLSSLKSLMCLSNTEFTSFFETSS